MEPDFWGASGPPAGSLGGQWPPWPPWFLLHWNLFSAHSEPQCAHCAVVLTTNMRWKHVLWHLRPFNMMQLSTVTANGTAIGNEVSPIAVSLSWQNQQPNQALMLKLKLYLAVNIVWIDTLPPGGMQHLVQIIHKCSSIQHNRHI